MIRFSAKQNCVCSIQLRLSHFLDNGFRFGPAVALASHYRSIGFYFCTLMYQRLVLANHSQSIDYGNSYVAENAPIVRASFWDETHGFMVEAGV